MLLTKLEHTQKQKIKPKKKKIVSGQIITYNILFYPTENIIKRNINLINTSRDLYMLGECHTYNPGFLNNRDHWNIFLVTDKPLEYIEDALFFIKDDCRIHKIAGINIFNDEEMEAQARSFREEYTETEPVKEIQLESIDVESKRNEKNIESGIKIEKQVTSRLTVSTGKLDRLMYLVSEFITTNSRIILASKESVYEPLQPYLEKLDSFSKQFRNNALDIRLIPVDELVVRFRRLIRYLSKLLGKKVEFITQGTGTELDKNTIDILAEPLMHIIRNALAHGIESENERIEKGKKTEGVIELTVYHSANHVFIQIQDNGKGLNTEKIREKAIEKGIITKSAELSEKKIFNLIFYPGFSTADNITEVSGRGVGMDVVKKTINEAQGEVEINTEKGLGTSFTIKLHQSISIIDTMLVKSADMYCLIPINDVEICNQVQPVELSKRYSSQTFYLEDELISYVDIRDIFKLGDNYPERLKIVVVSKNKKRFAIAVDTIIGEHQAVLKSLGQSFSYQKIISAGSLPGNGNLAFLLDINELFKTISKQENEIVENKKT